MADKLLSNFGHDILDALFWTATEPRGKKREHLGTLPHLLIAIIYVSILYYKQANNYIHEHNIYTGCL